MFALNGEEIKLDNTGQYELKNYEINSLGLIVKNNKETQSFIIDYEYTITS